MFFLGKMPFMYQNAEHIQAGRENLCQRLWRRKHALAASLKRWME